MRESCEVESYGCTSAEVEWDNCWYRTCSIREMHWRGEWKSQSCAVSFGAEDQRGGNFPAGCGGGSGGLTTLKYLVPPD